MSTRLPRIAAELGRHPLRPNWPGSCRLRPSTFLPRPPNRRFAGTASKTRPSTSSSRPIRPVPLTLLASGGLLATALGLSQFSLGTRAVEDKDARQDGRDPAKPRFRLADIKKHDAGSGAPWVTRGDKVYDVTDWVEAHPGGDVILRAAGGSIDPYWDIFTIHKSPHVYDTLEQYLIGYVDAADLVDGRPAREEIEDPFAGDPARDERLLTLTAKPRNAESPADRLSDSFLTPNELFYVRNHMWVPDVDGDGRRHTLTVELPDGEERVYTLDELRTRFPRHRITAALQCSGNRRRDMSENAAPTNGLQWGAGAISCAEWEGVRLSDVLADAGFSPDLALREGEGEGEGSGAARHVQFSGLEAYGASIPLHKAVDPRGDVLLAFAMNGRPLPRDHGFPLRALVPGHVAARSVKWLSRVSLSDEESPSQWQRRDYKCFGPNEGANPDWSKAPAIQEMPITSAITSVRLGEWTAAEPSAGESGPAGGQGDGATTPAARTDGRWAEVRGYAYSGGGREICRVDVSLDGGRTWDQARLVDEGGGGGGAASSSSPSTGHKSWAWKRWRYEGVVPLSETEGGEKDGVATATRRCSTLLVKATDDAYNSQPESYRAIYNVRGNLANAWHRMRVCSDCAGDGARDGARD